MTNYITVNEVIYSDGNTDEKGKVRNLANGGHRQHLLNLLKDTIIELDHKLDNTRAEMTKRLKDTQDEMDKLLLLADEKVEATGLSLQSISSSSLEIIKQGKVNLQLEIKKGFAIGSRIRIAQKDKKTSHFMDGVILSYDKQSGKAEVEVDTSGGNGQFNNWYISLVGERGAVGTSAIDIYSLPEKKSMARDDIIPFYHQKDLTNKSISYKDLEQSIIKKSIVMSIVLGG